MKIGVFKIHRLSKGISLSAEGITLIFLDDEVYKLIAWLISHGYGPQEQ